MGINPRDLQALISDDDENLPEDFCYYIKIMQRNDTPKKSLFRIFYVKSLGTCSP